MPEARALTNLVGNGVATMFISKMTGNLNTDKLHKELNQITADNAEKQDVPAVNPSLFQKNIAQACATPSATWAFLVSKSVLARSLRQSRHVAHSPAEYKSGRNEEKGKRV